MGEVDTCVVRSPGLVGLSQVRLNQFSDAEYGLNTSNVADADCSIGQQSKGDAVIPHRHVLRSLARLQSLHNIVISGR